jgi:cytochrome c-type biogenesis protein CcmH
VTATAALLALGLTLALAQGPAAAAPVSEEAVQQIAAELRCVVCQNLSVADSPSETAQQMRNLIRERLALGQSPEQVVAYFVERYGQWILLSPPRRGFNWLVWVLPFAGLALGLVLVGVIVRRWSRGARPAPPAPLDAAARERIQRALAEADSPR